MTEADSAGPPGAGLPQLLLRLDKDPERAGVEFERLRRALTKFFDWRGASSPEECTDETLDRLARKVEEGVAVLDVSGFAHGIARLVLRERFRSDARLAPLEAIELAAAPPPETQNDDALARSLDRCLDDLPRDGRDLVLAYYAGADGRSKIETRQHLASKLRLSDNALRSRVQRLRDRLEDCVRRRATATGREERR